MVHGGLLTQFRDYNHHDPDEEEGVANQDEKNRDFTDKEVNTISFKERAVLDDILVTAGVIGSNPECNPDSNVEDRSTTTTQEEVLVLHTDQGEGELHLQEQVQTFKKHPVEAGEVKEEGADPAGAVDLVKDREQESSKFWQRLCESH